MRLTLFFTETIKQKKHDEAIFIENSNSVVIHDIKSGYTNRCPIYIVGVLRNPLLGTLLLFSSPYISARFSSAYFGGLKTRQDTRVCTCVYK